MAQHPPPPPPPTSPRSNEFDLFESDDSIIEVYTDFESDSEQDLHPASRNQREKKAQPPTNVQSGAPIETTYECWNLMKAPARGKERRNWTRAERTQVSLPSDELARQAKKHRRTKSIMDIYDALSTDQRDHVEVLIREKKDNETNPNAVWELADIHRELYDKHKTRIRETTFIRVILRRQDRRKGESPKKPTGEAATPGNVVDLNDRARMLSLKTEALTPESQIKPKGKDQKHKRNDSRKFDIVVDGVNAPSKSRTATGPTHFPLSDQTARPTYGQTQPSRQVPRSPMIRDQQFEFPSSSGPRSGEALRPTAQRQTQVPQQTPFLQASWPQRHAQTAQQPQAQHPAVQQPTQSQARPTQFDVQQPGQSTLSGQMNLQQPGFPQAPPANPQHQTVQQQPAFQQQMPLDFQRLAQAPQVGAQKPAQPVPQIQGIFAGINHRQQQAGSQQQPQYQLGQQQQNGAPPAAYAAVNGGVHQPQPQGQPQPQPQPVSQVYPRSQQQAPRPPQPVEVNPFSSALPTGQPPQAEMGGRTGFQTNNLNGRFPILQATTHEDVTARHTATLQFAGIYQGWPDLQRNVSAGAGHNEDLPTMKQQNGVNDDRSRREQILQWQTQTRLDHSRSSSSFEEQSSRFPSVDTPQTSLSGGYPIDRGHRKQSAGHQTSSNRSSGYAQDQHEKGCVLPARSGRRFTGEEAFRLGSMQQETPMIVQQERRDRHTSRSPVRRTEKKKKSQKKKSSRKENSSSESPGSDDDQYERSSKRPSRRHGKYKRKGRKEDESSESSESESSDSDDGQYELSSRPRGRKTVKHGSQVSRNRSKSSKRRSDRGNHFDTRPRRRDEIPYHDSRRTSKAGSETASVVDVLSKRLQEIEERQAGEAERIRRGEERREAYGKGLEDAIAWRKSRPSEGFPGLG